MAELHEISVRKWVRNLSGLPPTLDFSNGARILDLCVDSSSNISWRCADNTTGSPKWVMEDIPGSLTIHDETVNSVVIGKTSLGSQFTVQYLLFGGAVHQSGTLTVSHNGTDIAVDNEYGGVSPTHKIDVSGEISEGNMILKFDTTEGVGSSLSLRYTVENKIINAQ
jgi:hypothetical protein